MIFKIIQILILTIIVTESTVTDVLKNGGVRRRRENRKYKESARKRFYFNTHQRYQKYLETIRILAQYTTHKAERYSPNIGYEPYWKDGDWVAQEAVSTTPGEITTKPPLVCGDECNPLYTNTGPVCVARPKRYSRYDFPYCKYVYGMSCLKPDTLDYFEYNTFENFCVYLQVQCKNPSVYESYYFAHVGECIPHINSTAQLDWGDFYTAGDMLKRLSSWVTGLSSRFAAMRLTTNFPAWYTDKK